MTDLETNGRANNRVRGVADLLRLQIADGLFAVGQPMPSQLELSQQLKVSRTVLREAIVQLQAEGLVEARHGAGVFVLSAHAPAPQGVASVDASRVSSILETLELRAAVESEAAGLAALRRSPAQEEAILAAHQQVVELVARGERSVDADFAFHLAIAEATNNPRFSELLTFLGSKAIPEITRQGNLDTILAEHQAIVVAISVGDEDGAKAAMRAHNRASQSRYRALLYAAQARPS